MYCPGCGTELHDRAKFCVECGAPLRGEDKAREPKWDICEIHYEATSGILGKNRLVAKAVGPNGVYEVATTPWRGGFSSSSTLELDKLLEDLVKDGWEYLGKDGRVLGRLR